MPMHSSAHQQLKQRVAKQLAADTTELLYQQPFLAMLLMRLNLCVVVDDRLQTAATDGTNIFADARFFDALSQRDRLFVLAHEVWHCAMGHFARRDFMTLKTRDAERWNHACDYEVNQIVREQLNHLAPFALYNEAFRGLSAEQIFVQLSKETPANRCTSEGHQFDCHDPHAGNDERSIMLDPEFRPLTPTPADANRWRQHVTQAAQVIRSRGGHLEPLATLTLERLLRPKLPWTALLRRYVEQSFGGGQTWNPISRRYAHQGLILPGQRTPTLSLAVAIDTSGSTSDDLTQFFSELYAILRTFHRVNVQLLECDSQVRRHSEFTERDLHKLTQWRPQGGGGTSFVPVFEYIATQRHNLPKPNLLVFFTDGFGDAPVQNPSYPVLWILAAGGVTPLAASSEHSLRQRISWGQCVQLHGGNL